MKKEFQKWFNSVKKKNLIINKKSYLFKSFDSELKDILTNKVIKLTKLSCKMNTVTVFITFPNVLSSNFILLSSEDEGVPLFSIDITQKNLEILTNGFNEATHEELNDIARQEFLNAMELDFE